MSTFRIFTAWGLSLTGFFLAAPWIIKGFIMYIEWVKMP